MEPKTLLTKHSDKTVTIDSTEDMRKKACRLNTPNTFFSIHPDSVAIRYEPDTGYMFVDASWLATELDDDNVPLLKSLQVNTQYKGTSSIRLLKGTGSSRPACRVHVFDLRAGSARRITRTSSGRVNLRSRLMREHHGDVAVVAKALALYDEADALIREPDENAEVMKQLLVDLKKERKALERLAGGMKPKSKRAKPKPVHLLALDQFIVESTKMQALDLNQVRLDQNARIPEFVRRDKPAPVSEENLRGVLKEHINLNGTNHTKRVHLKISELRKHVPNYRNDFRYVTSYATYARYKDEATEQNPTTNQTHKNAEQNPTTNQTHKNTTLYCAVFDLLRTRAKAEGEE